MFAYFNNDYNGDAVHDAQWFRDRLTRTRAVDYSETARWPPLTASPTSVAATSRSFRFVCCDGVLEHLERFLGVALVVADQDALGLFDHRARFEGGPELLAEGPRRRIGLGVGEGGSGMRDEHRCDLLVVGERVRRARDTG